MRWYANLTLETDNEDLNAEEISSLRPSARPIPPENPHKMRLLKKKKKHNLWRKRR